MSVKYLFLLLFLTNVTIVMIFLFLCAEDYRKKCTHYRQIISNNLRNFHFIHVPRFMDDGQTKTEIQTHCLLSEIPIFNELIVNVCDNYPPDVMLDTKGLLRVWRRDDYFDYRGNVTIYVEYFCDGFINVSRMDAYVRRLVELDLSV